LNLILFGDGQGVVIPIRMARPLVASRALSVLPILAALRADAAGIERIPDAAAGAFALPAGGGRRSPPALRTEYFHVIHGQRSCPAAGARSSWRVTMITRFHILNGEFWQIMKRKIGPANFILSSFRPCP
jgi:hypothetical protein